MDDRVYMDSDGPFEKQWQNAILGIRTAAGHAWTCQSVSCDLHLLISTPHQRVHADCEDADAGGRPTPPGRRDRAACLPVCVSTYST